MATECSSHYQVLAREWRPKQFTDVVWQNHVTQALSNALSAQRLHHAYLFTGTRGVGKTTLARIMAKCLSCEQGVSSTPCDQCNACISINHGQFIDLIEVDAASRTRVEDTRELLENAHYAPTLGRFKIYLIDEVHMLSSHSFNALLKTLEEPPEHVKFLFATTDPQRLPATLLSRCLQFHLKPIPNTEIVARLTTILAAQKIRAEAQALALIADAAAGSLRDALSLLDQVIDHQNQAVTAERTRQLLGFADPVLVLDILQAIADQQPQTALISLQQCRQQNADTAVILDQLLGFLHTLAVAQICPSELSKHAYAEPLTALAQSLSSEDIQLYYQIVLHGRRDLTAAPIADHAVEMTLVRLFAFQPQTSAPIPPATATVAETKPAAAKPAATETKAAKAEAPPPVSAPRASSLCATDWDEIVFKLPISGITATLAQHCQCSVWDGLRVELLCAPSHGPFLSDSQIARLQTALREFTGQNIKLDIELAQAELATPASKKAAQSQQSKAKAEQAIQADANVQQLLSAFDAKIDPNSIEARGET